MASRSKTLKLTVVFCSLITLSVSARAKEASTAKNTFQNFRGPKPGQWEMTAKVNVPGAKEIIQATSVCIKPGEDLKQRAIGQLGDASSGCVVTITKDTAAAGGLKTKCPNISASVDMTKISDNEFRYNVDSSMAKVVTTAKFAGLKCGNEIGKPQTARVSDCDSCKNAVDLMRKQCNALSDASRAGCLKSATKMSEQCAAQCKRKK
jgi:hypothetical protein